MKTLIKGGTVVEPHRECVSDVLIESGKIVAVGTDLRPAGDCHVISVNGLIVLPGMIDAHVHFDDWIGDWYLADTYRSGSKAAILTGITTVMSFVTQRPGQTLREAVRIAESKVERGSFCDVGFHLTPTDFSEPAWIEIESLHGAGHHSFKFYTTYKEAGLYLDYESLNRVCERLAAIDAQILLHCEDQAVLEHVHPDRLNLSNAYSHTALRPPEAEIEAIGRAIVIAERHGARLHVVHVSTAEGAKLIRARETNSRITCETAPHYLTLNDSCLAAQDGYRFLCSPPLRSESNREKLEELAADGAFDLFATDHCAFRRRDKDRFGGDVRRAPKGLAGVGALVPLMCDLLMTKHGWTWGHWCEHTALNPARLSGLESRKGRIAAGADADLVIATERGAERAIHSSLADCYDPYEGQTSTLDIRYVFLRGEMVVRDNELVNEDIPTGQLTYHETTAV